MDNFRKTITGKKALSSQETQDIYSNFSAGQQYAQVFGDYARRGYETPGIMGKTATQTQNEFLRVNLGSYEGTYLEPLFGDDFLGGLGYRDIRTGQQVYTAADAVNAINTSFAEYEAGAWQPGAQQRTNTEAQTVTPPAQNDPGAAAAAGDAGTAQQAATGSVSRRPTNRRTSRQSLTLADINPNASQLLGQ